MVKSYILGVLAFFILPASALAADEDILRSAPGAFSLMRQSTARDSLVIPFFVPDEIYADLFPKDTKFPYVFLRVHLYDTANYYATQKIVDLTDPEQKTVPALIPNPAGIWGQGTYTFADHNHFVSDLPPIPQENLRRIGVVMHVPILSKSHKNLSGLNLTARLYRPDETLQKIFFSHGLSWQEPPPPALVLTSAVEKYIQTGGLTCEFAAAKIALDMIGIPLSERGDLIPLFPQADVKDVSKHPTEYFLGDYAFGQRMPQALNVSGSSLGGYGLHIDQTYLTRVIHPFAPASQLKPFSLADLDQALNQNVPVIVQGLQITYDNTLLGGQALKVNEQDTRGLVTGEHAYVLFGKNADGNYLMKDPFKSVFKTITPQVLQRSVQAFEKYGAKANMVLVQKEAAVL